MVKKAFILVFILGLFVYLLIAMSFLNKPSAEARCTAVDIVLMEKSEKGFISAKEVKSILQSKGLFPQGERMHDINTRLIEQTLNQQALINYSECYKTSDDKIIIEIYQRIPILHVLSDNGEEYYIDKNGAIVVAPALNAAYLPIVTGAVQKKGAGNTLKEIGLYMKENPYWKDKIAQIHFTAEQNIELFPCEEDFTISLGSLQDYEKKMDRLQQFYKRGLKTIGWDKYSRINIEFSNQIICTKKEK